MDAWDGYPAARRRLLRSFVDGAVRNPVVLTGDVHRHYANDLLLDDRVVAAELVTTSVSSGGDGAERTALTDLQLAENPHLRWVDSRRGYVMLRLRSGCPQGGLQDRALRQPPRCPGIDGGVVRARGRSSRPRTARPDAAYHHPAAMTPSATVCTTGPAVPRRWRRRPPAAA